MNTAEAELDWVVFEADADSYSNSEIFAQLNEYGLPPEIIAKLHSLVDVKKEINNKEASVGKIILIRMIEFIRENTNLATCVAIGAVLSAIVSSVPVLGQILSPITTPIIMIVMALYGRRLDRKENGENTLEFKNFNELFKDAVTIASMFMKAVTNTFSLLIKA